MWIERLAAQIATHLKDSQSKNQSTEVEGPASTAGTENTVGSAVTIGDVVMIEADSAEEPATANTPKACAGGAAALGPASGSTDGTATINNAAPSKGTASALVRCEIRDKATNYSQFKVLSNRYTNEVKKQRRMQGEDVSGMPARERSYYDNCFGIYDAPPVLLDKNTVALFEVVSLGKVCREPADEATFLHWIENLNHTISRHHKAPVDVLRVLREKYEMEYPEAVINAGFEELWDVLCMSAPFLQAEEIEAINNNIEDIDYWTTLASPSKHAMIVKLIAKSNGEKFVRVAIILDLLLFGFEKFIRGGKGQLFNFYTQNAHFFAWFDHEQIPACKTRLDEIKSKPSNGKKVVATSSKKRRRSETVLSTAGSTCSSITSIDDNYATINLRHEVEKAQAQQEQEIAKENWRSAQQAKSDGQVRHRSEHAEWDAKLNEAESMLDEVRQAEEEMVARHRVEMENHETACHAGRKKRQ